MYKAVKVKLTGYGRGYIQHNGRLADPLNLFTIEMKTFTGKKKKTIKDHEMIAKLEWRGGLYVDDDNKPIIPADALQKCIIEGARKSKSGKLAEIGIMVDDDALLKYSGPLSIEKRENDPMCQLRVGVVVSRARIYRTRPLFRDWSAEATFLVDDSVVDDQVFMNAITAAGAQVGLGDWRPRHGRFTVEIVK